MGIEMALENSSTEDDVKSMRLSDSMRLASRIDANVRGLYSHSQEELSQVLRELDETDYNKTDMMLNRFGRIEDAVHGLTHKLYRAAAQPEERPKIIPRSPQGPQPPKPPSASPKNAWA